MNKAQKQAAEFEAFMERVREAGEPCKHGHFDCSDVAGGKCSDEAYGALSFEAQWIADNS